MFKKVIIPSMVFLGMFLMAFYTIKNEESVQLKPKVIADETNFYPVVLELFTSQGCSSCPPADLLLNKVKNEYPEVVYALSYHVDYWNYIGWEDPFSKPSHTKKQREYNIKFGSRSNYTPQLVVNGKEHFVGSDQSKMYLKINDYKKSKIANPIELKVKKIDKGSIQFDYTILGNLSEKQLRAVLVLDERTTVVKRGENKNRTLKNSNIVVSERYIPLKYKNGTSKITIPAIITENDTITLMLFVENDDLDINGAAKLQIKR
ncbi:hypothetical protein HME9304_02793 [Flagellimonas maritima]|uniref:DUF1223 domain-containing protein n=1 Tax=Flagellimonas maritima TaxID=1383885 RepID=A0A2Z4LVJ7_9FLAO|nr:DUF1223 domain-containing protein [Allomuricauda aurantiaca]AWX45763.1 hypothetical protein HME9304_02793 [Allomuricauda aurantiaca]